MVGENFGQFWLQIQYCLVVFPIGSQTALFFPLSLSHTQFYRYEITDPPQFPLVILIVGPVKII